MVLSIPFSLWIDLCTSRTLYYLKNVYMSTIFAFFFLNNFIYTLQNMSIKFFVTPRPGRVYSTTTVGAYKSSKCHIVVFLETKVGNESLWNPGCGT